MTRQLYMTLCTTSGSLGLRHYITLFDNMACSTDVDDMTRHDSASAIMLLLECIQAVVLLGDECLHGVSQLLLRMAKCAESSMVIGLLDVSLACRSLLECWKDWQADLFTKGACLSVRLSVSTSCMFSHSSVREHIFS